ncbi:trigger factor [Halofilum ochraceum]|uniref:trigger factor n=1 Tax=Halofilum ochraceum TaxID=1611323 RepID=UPI0008DAF306|nr:trigger factor [Halofilum ochraceum]
MQVSVERQEGLERTLKVEIPSDRIEGAVEERLNRLQKQVRLDGFRPGKVPMRVVRTRYGGQVRQEVVGELIQSTLQEAVTQVEMQPAGSPRIDSADEQPDEGGMAYTATFEVYPEIELGEISDLAVEKPVAEVTEADVDGMIETLQKQRQEFEEVDRPAEQGDRVVIDFVGRIDGEAFEGGSGEDTPVDLGAGRMIDGFEDQLEGIRPSEERELEVKFPEEYGSSELAGRDATFSVTCKSVQAGRLPEVDEEFARQFGIESGSVDELRDGLRRNMERELKQALEAQVKRQVMDALVQRHPIDVPDALVSEEIGRLREQMKQRLGGQMGDEQLPDDLFREEALRRVRLGLLLSELVQNNGIQADDEAVREKVEEMASAYDDPQQVVQHYYENQQMLQGVQAMVVEDRVVDWILERANVTEKQTNFDEVMQQQNGQ